jgi:hypothetical protein
MNVSKNWYLCFYAVERSGKPEASGREGIGGKEENCE